VGRAEISAAPHAFTASPGAQWTRGRAGVMRLEQGHFEAQASAQLPQRLQTPEVTVAATNARFAMDVTEQGTTVAVFEGTAEVATARTRATLHAGETRHFGIDAPSVPREVVPIALEPVALDQGSPACVHAGSLEAQLTCLGAQARGEDLKAQAALYEEGNLEAQAHRPAGAAETYRESLRRFPDGVLAPEVTLALMRLLASEQQYDGAIEAGQGFLKSWPDDPRCEDVKGFVSRLEWLRAR
jgi:TolA-binding protein